MIAKMKSLWASGSHDHFSRLAPRPTPHQPPDASAQVPWVDCQQAPNRSAHSPDSQVPTRSIRLLDDVTATAATAAPAAAARASIRIRTPATTSMAATRIIMTAAVPRSCPSSTSPRTRPATRPTGTTTCCHWCSSGALRASTAAHQTTRASLAASEGWARTPATSIQFELPLIAPTPSGVKTSSWNTIAPITSGQATRFQNAIERREANHRTARPTTANTACRQNTENAEPLWAMDSTDDDESTMTRPTTTSARVAPSSR